LAYVSGTDPVRYSKRQKKKTISGGKMGPKGSCPSTTQSPAGKKDMADHKTAWKKTGEKKTGKKGGPNSGAEY